MLFYPLYPFFVLFTHAVSVSSVQDYQLLANVTNGLREFSGQNSALMGVQKLFEGFMVLCKPTFRKDSRTQTSSVVQEATQSTARGASPPSAQGSSQVLEASEQNRVAVPWWTNPFATIAEEDADNAWSSANGHSSGVIPDFSSLDEHDLLTELYNTQPSIGWIDAPWPSASHP